MPAAKWTRAARNHAGQAREERRAWRAYHQARPGRAEPLFGPVDLRLTAALLRGA